MFPSTSDSPFLVLWHFYLLFVAVVVTWQLICLAISALIKLRLRSLIKPRQKSAKS